MQFFQYSGINYIFHKAIKQKFIQFFILTIDSSACIINLLHVHKLGTYIMK